MSAGEGVEAAKPLSEEDVARADLYALIGRLFYDAPDSLLIAELCQVAGCSPDDDGPLGQSWRALQGACKSAYPVVVKQEYDNLFVGVGKSEVTPYTSHYAAGASADRHLVRLRERLDEWGYGRRGATFEVEDHVAGICDVMRMLVVDGRPLREQSLFFNEFTYPGMAPFCAAVAAAASAAFYRHVARLASAFLELERQAFDMQDTEA